MKRFHEMSGLVPKPYLIEAQRAYSIMLTSVLVNSLYVYPVKFAKATI